MQRKVIPHTCWLALAGGIALTAPVQANSVFNYHYVDTYKQVCGDDDSDEGCAEISAYDPQTQRTFTTNATGNAIRVLQLDSDGKIADVASLSLASYGAAPNSVAVSHGKVAVAVEAEDKQSPGQVVLFDTETLEMLASITVGALPDMVVFTPDGNHLLVANEGEPDSDYLVDPEGSVSVIDTNSMTVRTAGFGAFNALTNSSVRIFGPGATVAQDLEPEYIAVSDDSSTAWISLQENNALAVLDIATAQITRITGLGTKDHSLHGNGFDASNRDGGDNCAMPLEDESECIIIEPHPTRGMYQPDAIAAYTVDGQQYIVSANEGDARDYDGFSEEARVGDDEYLLDDSITDSLILKDEANLGRLNITLASGDTDGDGDFDIIYSYGARSFSIWNALGEQVFDSGDDFEQRLADMQANGFDVWTDSRSDDKGPEPESVTLGEINGKTVAFIGLERVSGVFAYDVSAPASPQYLGYIDTKRAGDLSPEGLVYIASEADSGVLLVTNEVSNTISSYQVSLSGASTISPDPDSSSPLVSGNTISWNSDDYYQVQSVSDYNTICEGSNLNSCTVEAGTYNVINLSTGQRFENIEVGASSAPSITGNVISWNSDDYYQVQSVDDYRSICEGSNLGSCTVESGTYNVINLSTGERFENIEVDVDDASEGGSDSFSLKILHINDHHSHLAAESSTLTLDGQDTDVELGGFPRVVTQINELAEQSDAVLKLHAGDAITGTLFYTLFGGEADAALMNEVCFDAFSLGNHEFDDGDAGLAYFLDHLNSSDCVTDVLAANVVPEVGVSPLALNSATDYIKPWTIKTVNGQQIGIIGIDIANKTKNSSNPDESTQFLDETITAQRYIDELTTEGINKIVLMTHYQYANDLALAGALSGVDVIVGGDSHTLLGQEFSALGLNPQGPYPSNTLNADGDAVCVVQAWQYSYVVGELDVSFDDNGRVTQCAGTPHLLIGDSFEREDASGESAVLTGDELQTTIDAVNAIPQLSMVTPDPDATLTLDQFTAMVDVLGETRIGSVAENLCLERVPGQGLSQLCDVAETSSQGSDISNLVALAFKSKSNTSDIAIQNGGGVRIDIPAGELTVADAYTLLPFSNTLLEIDLTGQQIIDTLEDALDFALDEDGSTGAYPYASGLRWNIDASQDKGARFTQVEVKLKDEDSWAAIDVSRIYKVVTNDFIASGSDGYDTLGEISDALKVDTFLDYAESFVDYAEEVGTLQKLSAEDYSTQSYINVDGVQQ